MEFCEKRNKLRFIQFVALIDFYRFYATVYLLNLKDIKQKYRTDFISYPFLKEEFGSCDHELLTDKLSSELALISTKLNDYPREKELIDLLVSQIYHVNGSIRGNLAITEEDVLFLHSKYIFYKEEVKDLVNGFLLPTGNEIGCLLHLARCSGKHVVRNMHKTERAGLLIDSKLYDFMNVFSNLMFVLALYINKCENYTEKKFVSKSY